MFPALICFCFCFFLSLIVLGQKSSPALAFVDGRQDRWTRNINICVGMSQWRLTPEALESKNRERKDKGLSHSLVSAAQFSVLLTTGWPDLPRLWMRETALVGLSFFALWCERLVISLTREQQSQQGSQFWAYTCTGLHYALLLWCTNSREKFICRTTGLI